MWLIERKVVDVLGIVYWIWHFCQIFSGSLHGFRIFISIDYKDIDLEWKKVLFSWFSSRDTRNVIIWESII